MTKRPRVLLSVFACEPGQGSEAGYGWNLAVALARENDVWAVTDILHRPAIETHLSTEPIRGLKIAYHTIPFGEQINRLKRKNKPLWEFYYYIWQLTVFLTARKICLTEKIDITHHGNYARYWMPSSLAILPKPFIWGPIGAGDSCPPSLFSTLSTKGKVFELARNLARRIADFDPLVRLTARKSAAAFGTTQKTIEKMKALGAGQVSLLCDSLLNVEEIKQLDILPLPPDRPLRFISLGRLRQWKGTHLGIRAFARAKLADAEYWIIGDGPDRSYFEKVARDENVEDQVRFLGKIPREQVYRCLEASHVLVHPSLHDSGSWVCLEAMAAGRPVICLDIGGPKVIVGSDCGVKVPVHNAEQVIDDLAAGMKHLAGNPAMRNLMGQAGKKRVTSEFTWINHARLVSAVYRRVLGESSMKNKNKT